MGVLRYLSATYSYVEFGMYPDYEKRNHAPTPTGLVQTSVDDIAPGKFDPIPLCQRLDIPLKALRKGFPKRVSLLVYSHGIEFSYTDY